MFIRHEQPTLVSPLIGVSISFFSSSEGYYSTDVWNNWGIKNSPFLCKTGIEKYHCFVFLKNFHVKLNSQAVWSQKSLVKVNLFRIIIFREKDIQPNNGWKTGTAEEVS